MSCAVALGAQWGHMFLIVLTGLCRGWAEEIEDENVAVRHGGRSLSAL